MSCLGHNWTFMQRPGGILETLSPQADILGRSLGTLFSQADVPGCQDHKVLIWLDSYTVLLKLFPLNQLKPFGGFYDFIVSYYLLRSIQLRDNQFYFTWYDDPIIRQATSRSSFKSLLKSAWANFLKPN